MTLSARYKKISARLLFLCIPLIISACKNDLDTIKRLTHDAQESDTEATTNVDLIQSQDAVVTVRMTAPLMLSYKGKDPHYEAPKGITVIRYYDKLRQDSTVITADYCVSSSNNEIVTFKKNVVIKNAKGDVFKSEELVLNQLTKKITSSKQSSILSHDGNYLAGDTFISNDDLSNPTFTNAHGHMNYADSAGKGNPLQ